MKFLFEEGKTRWVERERKPLLSDNMNIKGEGQFSRQSLTTKVENFQEKYEN